MTGPHGNDHSQPYDDGQLPLKERAADERHDVEHLPLKERATAYERELEQLRAVLEGTDPELGPGA